MKHRTHESKHTYSRQPLYPNAADPTYFAGKAQELLTAIISGLGFTTVMVFLMILA